jgi:RNA recognition motif-containing protein
MSQSGASAATPASTSTGEVEPNTTVYVGNLFFEVSEESLERLFAEHGNIKKTRIVYDHRGLSKGYDRQLSLSAHSKLSC